MSDSDVPDQLTQGFLAEDLRYQTHTSKDLKLLAIGCGDTGAFLAAVLECE